MNNDIIIYDFFLSFFFFFNHKIDMALTIGKLNRRDNDGMMMNLNFINFVNSILIWLWDRRIPWRVLNSREDLMNVNGANIY